MQDHGGTPDYACRKSSRKLCRLYAVGKESSGTKAESTVSGDTSAEASDTDEEEEPAIKATTVSYSKAGKYTTTVTSDKVDLSGINAENVKVRYSDPYSNLLTL